MGASPGRLTRPAAAPKLGRGLARFRRLMAAAALGCLIVLLVTSAEATVEPAPGTGGSPPSSLQAAGAPGVAQEDGRQGTSQTECEQRLQSDRRPGVPTVVIVGASITAGVGAEDPPGPPGSPREAGVTADVTCRLTAKTVDRCGPYKGLSDPRCCDLAARVPLSPPRPAHRDAAARSMPSATRVAPRTRSRRRRIAARDSQRRARDASSTTSTQ
jgi:hypothetical protein